MSNATLQYPSLVWWGLKDCFMFKIDLEFGLVLMISNVGASLRLSIYFLFYCEIQLNSFLEPTSTKHEGKVLLNE